MAKRTIPKPAYTSWAEFLNHTRYEDVLKWCQQKAATANRRAPSVKLEAHTVLDILMQAKGRCWRCGSLAVEQRSDPSKWKVVGRRVGSLGHVREVCRGGTNDASNLRWECLWCNDSPRDRVPGATDRGGIQVVETEDPPGADCTHPRWSIGGLEFVAHHEWCTAKA